ncbi:MULTISPECIES: hypothetical protein [unclassified Microcoleus]|uniref:hypothetical protein n=1 Tax=unclassified Microcoleus TaxID=2642155 RepID=UPI002FD28EDE
MPLSERGFSIVESPAPLFAATGRSGFSQQQSQLLVLFSIYRYRRSLKNLAQQKLTLYFLFQNPPLDLSVSWA